MAFKDMLETLKQGTEQIQQRRSLGEEALSSMLPPPSQQANNPGGGGRRNKGGQGPVSGGGGPAKNRMQAFIRALAEQESGGSYSAVGVPTKYGTAQGKYQILDSNIAGPGGWDQDALGRDISVQKFLNTPRLQEKIARDKLRYYFKQYGAEGAAKSWYAGEGNANTNSDSSQYGGPSINDYAAQVLQKMRNYLP